MRRFGSTDWRGGRRCPDLRLPTTFLPCSPPLPLHFSSTICCGLQYSGAYSALDVDNTRPLLSSFRITPIRLTANPLEFDMLGIDDVLANAFCRILIAEIPTIAIEHILFVNTSVVTDEVLAQRLGLIPLDADPRLFDYLSENDTLNENNTIVYKLKASCPQSGPRLSVMSVVKSEKLEWLPNGSELLVESPNPTEKPKSYMSFSCSQDSMEKFKKSPGLKHQDIIITELGSGQEVELEVHDIKGIGKTHARWSPVSTAWYSGRTCRKMVCNLGSLIISSIDNMV